MSDKNPADKGSSSQGLEFDAAVISGKISPAGARVVAEVLSFLYGLELKAYEPQSREQTLESTRDQK